MPKYAEWIEYKRGGRNKKILKIAIPQKRKIYKETEDRLLIEDQEGPIWIYKKGVRITGKEEDQ